MADQQDDLRFPVGKFEPKKNYTIEETRRHIETLEVLPKKLKKLLDKLNNYQINLAYRPGGWTVRQVVHHLADSHINAYLRIKLALSALEVPTINPYPQEIWAEMEDGKKSPVKWSVKLLTSLHERWTMLLRSLDEKDLNKTYYHPGTKKIFTISEAIAMYDWHSRHHLGHIKIVAKGKGVEPTFTEVVPEPIATPQPTDEAPVIKKGKAGRPKKHTTAAESTTSAEAPVIKKGKAGRPKKDTAAAESTTTDEAPVIKKGKAGRPKKDIVAVAESTTSAEAPVIKKGKAGRPKKDIVAAESTTSAEAPVIKKGKAGRPK
jgi:SOS-response transcriptional repressor LexA